MTSSSGPDQSLEPIDIRLRAFLHAALKPKTPRRKSPPSPITLTFDCETRTDASQRLRFGAYRLDLTNKRGEQEPPDEGLFYDEAGLEPGELGVLQNYAKMKGFRLLPFEAFTEEILFRWCYDNSGIVVGFNLPFDLSRLALDVSQARKLANNRTFDGGFTFTLSRDEKRPQLRIRHVDRRRAFFGFHNEQSSGYRGHFVDVKTLAGGLLSGTSDLASVADVLDVTPKKSDGGEHGAFLTPEYIDYALNDVRCTYACYQALLKRLDQHDLPDMRPMDVFSEASIGKAYLRSMGVQPWRNSAKQFPNELIGVVMSTYFGGRTEVRIRREVREVVYTDFMSMYPTVNTLQGLWRFLIADHVDWDDGMDAAEWAQAFLDDLTPERLQDQAIWRDLPALVQILPDDDLLPIRAQFGSSTSTNIGLNHLTSKTPLWFTLADCAASKMLTGKSPRVLKAVRFSPGPLQSDLKKKRILGLPHGLIDPARDDFFKRLIELRQKVKDKIKLAESDEKTRLKIEQRTLKIIANATSYGQFIEMRPEKLKKNERALFGHRGEQEAATLDIMETPGEFFHPMLATLITGAARLMLALAERKGMDEGLVWSFCDTDGLALAKPPDVEPSDFYTCVDRVVNWFKPLNPYDGLESRSILQYEDENFVTVGRKRKRAPLYCYAVSAKRYALFNIQSGKVVIRKASAHGLGFWRKPFSAPGEAPDTGAPFWQSELWRLICQAVLEGRANDGFTLLEDERFLKTAAGQTTVSKWDFYEWFKRFNEGRDYRDGVQPFNFLLRFPAKKRFEIEPDDPAFSEWCDCNPGEPSLVAPFDTDTDVAARFAFHRDAERDSLEAGLNYSGWLTSFADVLNEYDIHAEAKFIGGDGLKSGVLKRRHVEVRRIFNVGKESHEWEENEALGLKSEAEVQFGASTQDEAAMAEAVREALLGGVIGSNKLADAASVSRSDVSKVRNGRDVSLRSLRKMYSFISTSASVFWKSSSTIVEMQQRSK